MRIKVCGMKHPDNIKALGQLNIDFIGFIFYQKSPRYMDKIPLASLNKSLSGAIERVGVFVNEEMNLIMKKVNEYNIDLVQLHGNEPPEFCQELNKTMPIIKAFNVGTKEDFSQTERYEDCCNYFLFDTKTPQHGGSGQKFDWNILQAYTGETPFFLSGGISETDVEEIKKIKHSKFYGIDLNSKFEIEPGLKDITKLEKFINDIRS